MDVCDSRVCVHQYPSGRWFTVRYSHYNQGFGRYESSAVDPTVLPSWIEFVAPQIYDQLEVEWVYHPVADLFRLVLMRVRRESIVPLDLTELPSWLVPLKAGPKSSTAI